MDRTSVPVRPSLARRRPPRVLFWVAGVAFGAAAFGCAAAGNAIEEDAGAHRDGGVDASADDDGGALYDSGVIGVEPDANAPVDAGDGGTDDGGAQDPACAFPNTCTAARDVGTVSADTDGNPLTVTGTSSEWLKFKATEDNSSIFGHDFAIKFTLISPDSADDNLFVYLDENAGADGRACTKVTSSSTKPAAQIDALDLTYGESLGSDDTHTISVRVEHAGGPCGPGNEWKLTIEGNK